MIELCELSQEGVIDIETGSGITKMSAMEATKLIHLETIDICNFIILHFMNYILEL